MRVSYASVSAPGAINEDYVVAGPNWVVVLDGATAPAGVGSGCIHDVVWLVRQLAAGLSSRLSRADMPLADCLAEAITEVSQAHADTCDLQNPSSPSATVAMLRINDERVDYLALADSPIVLEVNGAVHAIIDDRINHLPDYTTAAVRAARNTPTGFWVASTKPEAAYESLHGSFPTAGVTRAAVLSDGASRYVDTFHLTDWAGLLNTLEKHGPGELIRLVREAEAQPPAPKNPTRRTKQHDDATAVFIAV